MRIKQSFKHRSSGMLPKVILFFALQVVLNLNGLYSNDGKSMERLPDVSIRFEFDERLEARPYRVFLKKEEEFYNILEFNDLNRVRLFQPGQTTYDFYNIKPGIYWVGITLNYLQKDGRVEECEFVRPWISTEGPEDTTNRIELKKNKRVVVDLIIQIRFVERPNGMDESDEYFRYVPRSRPKSLEEELMMDENYFPLGLARFINVERDYSKNIAHSKLEFLIDGFDDYPFEDSQPMDNK